VTYSEGISLGSGGGSGAKVIPSITIPCANRATNRVEPRRSNRPAGVVPVRIGRDGVVLDVERNAEVLEVLAELRDVVAVHQIVGVGVEQVDGGSAEHERDVVFAREDADPDAHGLERPMRRSRIGRDHHQDGLLVGHGGWISSVRRSGRCR
jgi:hypothetical protein